MNPPPGLTPILYNHINQNLLGFALYLNIFVAVVVYLVIFCLQLYRMQERFLLSESLCSLSKPAAALNLWAKRRWTEGHQATGASIGILGTALETQLSTY